MAQQAEDGVALRRRLTKRARSARFRPGLRLAGSIMLVLAIGAGAAACGGGSKKSSTKTPGTAAAVSKTPAETPTPGANAGLKTPIAISPGSGLTAGDLEARGHGDPGRGEFTGSRLVIPKIELNAEFSFKVVGTDGQMPNPNGPTDVAYYDFGQWPGLGGLPGKGGNTVIAGHVDYINYGPAVFWRLHELEVGDIVQVQLADGSTVSYKVEFNKQIEVGDADWTGIVDATAEESITLITCGGQFEAGHYSNRQIVWGRRV